uniref:F-box domain-containing protein n=1 Tax=Brassica campestris TaxID=3711 RepID=M4E277_BRACM
MELQLNTESKILLINGRENSKPLPIDLVMEILSRLPVKSIGRCLCVSKLWASILRLPYFSTLFTTRSSVRPHMLLSYGEKGQVLFFSSPQLKNPNENASLTANYLSRVPYGGYSCHINDPVHGMVCLTYIDKEISKEHIICNPSTGQTLTLPKVKTTMVGVRSIFKLVSFLGYVPTDKQFKVLSMEWNSDHIILGPQHQVLTLGTQKLEWRLTKCCMSHYFCPKGICINGVLYYRALDAYTGISMIVCFDFKSEEFSYIEVVKTFTTLVLDGPLINYNGKLGLLIFEGYPWGDRARSFELLVIGDLEKQEWSTHKYMLPPTWKNVVGEGMFCFAGFFGTNTIVLSRRSYVIYYNIDKNTIVKVGIQGVEAFKCFDRSIFLHHVEGLMLVQEF